MLGRHYLTAVIVSLSLLTGKADEKVRTQYHEWHEQCREGSTKTIDENITRFEKKLAKNPKDDLAKTYLGSCFALRSKNTFWGPKKLSYLKKSSALIEEAIESSPDNHRVRMIRAIGYYQLPKRFKKNETALSDFEKLIPLTKNKTLPKNERQAILYHAHLAFLETDKEKSTELRSLCHQIDPTSKYGELTK